MGGFSPARAHIVWLATVVFNMLQPDMTMKSNSADTQISGGIPQPEGDQAKPARKIEDLPPAARRALAEADERRKSATGGEQAAQREIGGRGGKDPARFGDWEVKGIAVDF